MGNKHRERIKRVRAMLFKKQGGLCHWCGVEMRIEGYEPKRGPPDPLLCTLDHLYDRYHPLRHCKHYRGERRYVAACWACNNRRSAEATAALSVQELRDRANKGGRREDDNSKVVHRDPALAETTLGAKLRVALGSRN